MGCGWICWRGGAGGRGQLSSIIGRSLGIFGGVSGMTIGLFLGG